MKVTAVYFSPTGNTKKSIEAMAKAIAPDFETIDLTMFSNSQAEKIFSEDDFVIFGMPVYAGRIPAVAVPRLLGIKAKNTPCILAATYGNRDYDDALVEMEDILKKQGFIVKGAAALVGRHTYGEIQTNRPDENDLKADAEFAKKAFAREKMENVIPGNRPYRPLSDGGHFSPRTSEDCTKCGMCSNLCPTGAIDENYHVIEDTCIACFRCIRICPVHAKNMDTEQYHEFAKEFTKSLSKRRENEYIY